MKDFWLGWDYWFDIRNFIWIDDIADYITIYILI